MKNFSKEFKRMNRYGSSVKHSSSNNSSAVWWVVGFFILILIISFGCWCTTDHFKQTFGNVFGNGHNLKELDVVMFMSPKCKYCQGMMETLKNEGATEQLEIVDITTQEGAQYASKFGADKQPIPSFISKKYKTGAVGQRKSVKEIIEALTPKSSQEPSVNTGGSGDLRVDVQSLQIILFARDGCPYCVQAKEACSNAGVMDVIQVVDITTPEGQELAGKMLPPGTSGVPAWVSAVTKKHVVGYAPGSPLEQVVAKLK